MARKLALIAALAGILVSAAALAPHGDQTASGVTGYGAGTLSLSSLSASDQGHGRS